MHDPGAFRQRPGLGPGQAEKFEDRHAQHEQRGAGTADLHITSRSARRHRLAARVESHFTPRKVRRTADRARGYRRRGAAARGLITIHPDGAAAERNARHQRCGCQCERRPGYGMGRSEANRHAFSIAQRPSALQAGPAPERASRSGSSHYLNFHCTPTEYMSTFLAPVMNCTLCRSQSKRRSIALFRAMIAAAP